MFESLKRPQLERRASSKTADRAVRAMRAEKREEQRRADRAIRAAARKRSRRAAGALARRAVPVIGAAVPVALVNATAFIGQFAWVQAHVPWILPGQVLFAVALESVAIYLAWHAHLAQLANDSAGRLKLGAYLFALVIGGMNYSHYAVSWHPNALAVGLGLMSALSPWLWGVHSRRASRDQLKARGLIEEHAVRLGATRWMWHPLRSMTVTSASAWTGENDPKRAIAFYDVRQAARRAKRDARQLAQAAQAAQAAQQEAIRTGAPSAQPGALSQPRQAGVAQTGAPAIAPVPMAQLPGANGKMVGAIAGFQGLPTMAATHPLDPQRVAEAELHLAGLPVTQLPAERTVSDMLCDQPHNHRRQAGKLIAARKALGPDPLPAFTRPSRPVNGTSLIASPAATLPGGIQRP